MNSVISLDRYKALCCRGLYSARKTWKTPVFLFWSWKFFEKSWNLYNRPQPIKVNKTIILFFWSKSKYEISAHSLQLHINCAQTKEGGLALDVNFCHLGLQFMDASSYSRYISVQRLFMLVYVLLLMVAVTDVYLIYRLKLKYLVRLYLSWKLLQGKNRR